MWKYMRWIWECCLSPAVNPESCQLVQAFLAECPGRLFLGHAQVQLKTGLQTQERHLFLFTDILLVTKAKSSTNFKVKAQVRVCEMWTANCMEEVCEGSTSTERSFVMGWPTCNCVVTFSSEEQKEKWLSLIRRQLNEGKENDDPKTIPLKIFAKDIGNCAYAKTLAVNNADTTADVIRMALLQFGISGCVKDYRLWVNSSKDEPPYPLIGHEFPFSIKMSHIRDSGSAGAGFGGAGCDQVTPTDCPGVLLLDQCLPPDTQCQFILKSSKADPGQTALIEPGQQKTFKRKRSLINWPFWKGSNSQLDGLPLSPTSLSPTLGQLFGRPLSSLCSENTALPKPVMDMLVFLYMEGPYTSGVFRRSAGAKACRELRDRLDTGVEDPEITHQSVFVIAAVLKDFLRSIPGSLLCSDLYDQWMNVMEVDGGEDRTQAVHRLLRLLPSENLQLLRHVISVLHSIHGNALDNQMNAFNLSVCIAPSMLWAPVPSTLEMEGEGTKKVCELVRFLIEECSSLLGEDVTSLFKAHSPKSSNSDHGSDASSFQMNDSSYDSLENELNDDPESPYQEQPSLLDKADSRSFDSVSDPETELLQLPPLARPRRFNPAVRQARGRQSHSLSQGPRRLRRSSEPALEVTSSPPSGTKTVDKHCASQRKASYDAAIEGEGEEQEDEVFLTKGMDALQVKENVNGHKTGLSKVINGGRRKLKHAPPPPLRLDASCSSLSSPATSPTGSSLSSLDSAFSQYSNDCTSNGGHSSGDTAYLHSGQAHLSPKSSPPLREALRSHPPRTNQAPSHGAHPNTWLTKDRRLSLKQSNGNAAEEKRKGSPNINGCITTKDTLDINGNCQRRASSPPSYQQALQQLQQNHSPFYRGLEKPLTVKELRLLHDQTCPARPTKNSEPHTESEITQKPVQPPRGVFYGQNATTLVLKKQKSHSLTLTVEGYNGSKTLPRCASEPTKMEFATQHSKPSKSCTLDRPHTCKRRQSSDLDPDLTHASLAPPFSLSPSSTRTVTDYFSSQGNIDTSTCLQRSQEVALAIVQGKREWQSRQCSEPRVDEFDKLFFAEESYV
ncbi:rho GTPase-activating protein 20 isoform X2 [Synchiropus splendidus]|uniref:rho GTPase-activating protein 20 isoform X2 n=1 Tax=Synchiropus splendidus TaxID=270530 RepID=UPI00237EB0EC|nr:rho GTPase-activating protein 20 isoform X2 [Synchiropus splendidus]